MLAVDGRVMTDNMTNFPTVIGMLMAVYFNHNILLYAHSICECHSRGCHTVSRMELVPYGRFYDTRSG